ncbi:MAG TPA: D-2-hydroxyacid dehydrogenase [Bryobacteraceae bacterium]|nr:D-2-hydroxyacid dehydrogenase [Bryobacteraceae bacterium]
MTTLLVLAHADDPELPLLKELPSDVRVVTVDRVEALSGAALDADIILAWWAPRPLLEAAFAQTRNLKWVHSASTGVDTVLFPALIESPVPLTNARGAFSASLAEFTVLAMLSFAKDVRRMLRQQAAASWEPFDVEMLAGRTLGVVGYGDIGRAIAQLARPFGMRILALRRRPELSGEDPLVDRAYGSDGLLEMLTHCDYVAATAPLTPSTHGLIGPAAFSAMKREAVLINVGRGAVIDEPALIRALEGGDIRGAALDVFETEPLPAGHPFWKMEDVLLSPHCADHIAGWRADAMRVFLDNFRRFRAGEPLKNIVDKRTGY